MSNGTVRSWNFSQMIGNWKIGSARKYYKCRKKRFFSPDIFKLKKLIRNYYRTMSLVLKYILPQKIPFLTKQNNFLPQKKNIMYIRKKNGRLVVENHIIIGIDNDSPTRSRFNIVHLIIIVTYFFDRKMLSRSYPPWNSETFKNPQCVLLIETGISRHAIKANRPHRSWHLTLRSVIARPSPPPAPIPRCEQQCICAVCNF